MPDPSPLTPVALRHADAYEPEALRAALEEMGTQLGIGVSHFSGRRVVVKPNLVAAMRPDLAATTEPALLGAVADFLRAHGAGEILVAESPGGIYSEAVLRHIYSVCGIAEAAEAASLTLNTDTSSVTVSCPDGKVCHSFSVIRPIAEADVIIDLCRLKAHALTRLSCAVKNFFGVVPGVEKFEMHSAYPTMPVFSEMLVDLCGMLCRTHEVWAICDAITAMEGNGPTGGTPRPRGVLLMSASPFCLDLAAERLVGWDGTIPTTQAAAARGLCPASPDEVTMVGGDAPPRILKDFREPDTSSQHFLRNLPNFMGGRFARSMSPRPVIDRARCLGCGVCVRSCPRHTIVMETARGKKRARIRPDGCIRCFCCQELCPHRAVKIRKNPLLLLIQRIR